MVRPTATVEWLKLQSLSNPPPPVPTTQRMALPSVLAKGNSDISDLPEPEDIDTSPLIHRSRVFLVLKRSKAYFYLMTALALLSFVLDDVRTVVLPQSTDTCIDAVLLAILGIFLFDIAIQAKTSSSYLYSLSFWLDLWATIGLLTHVSFISTHVFSECRSWYFYRIRLTVTGARLSSSTIRLIRHSARNAFQDAKVRKIDSSYTPSSFGSRVVKNSDLPVAKYSSGPLDVSAASAELHRESTGASKKKLTHGGTFNRLVEQASLSSKLHPITTTELGNIPYESKISKIITLKIVTFMVVLAILVTSWNWGYSALGGEDYDCREYGLMLLSDAQKLGVSEAVLWEFVSRSTGGRKLQELVKVKKGEVRLWEAQDDYRNSELCTISYGDFQATYSISLKLRLFAIFELCEALLLLLLLLYVCLSISGYFRRVVLYPLERMTETFRQIWRNPLHFMKSKGPSRSNNSTVKGGCWGYDYVEGEIRLLENAFRKIGVMLGLVYGSAGSEMITSSIGLEGNFTPLIPGREILAIFCFVKIGNFDAVLSKLGPDVLKYINHLSNFVHNLTERFLGSVNRNLGDSYLLLWKVPEDDKVMVGDRLVVNPFSSVVKSTAALALMFAVKTIAKVAANPTIVYYQQKIGGGDKVNRLTFGFHIGWAYEGPIGSAFKIDASYLSPNVNMAARVETAAEQYDVRILVSHDMYYRLGEEIRAYLRHIDTVKLKGVYEPVMLYSFDICDVLLDLSYFRISKRKTQIQRRKLKQALEENLLTVAEIFEESDTVKMLRSRYTREFMDLYAEGLKLYLEGRWTEACECLKRCLGITPDGPALNLLDYITAQKRPPVGWAGVRQLETK